MIGWWLNLAWHVAWLVAFLAVGGLGFWRWVSNRRRPSFGQAYREKLRTVHLARLAEVRDQEIAELRRGASGG